MIRDEAHIHSIAGIIGCQRSRISDETSSFVLESAHFPSQDIACTSQRLCLNTDAAYRFERGLILLDLSVQWRSLFRCWLSIVVLR